MRVGWTKYGTTLASILKLPHKHLPHLLPTCSKTGEWAQAPLFYQKQPKHISSSHCNKSTIATDMFCIIPSPTAWEFLQFPKQSSTFSISLSFPFSIPLFLDFCGHPSLSSCLIFTYALDWPFLMSAIILMASPFPLSTSASNGGIPNLAPFFFSLKGSSSIPISKIKIKGNMPFSTFFKGWKTSQF